MGALHLTLASASPRRRELLERLGVEPDAVTPANIDETPHRDELPREYALRMGRQKAAAIDAPGYVLAGDTVVSAGRRILPKTDDEVEARTCLELLSGRRHDVLSSVVLRAPDGTVKERVNANVVRFKRLSDEEIDHYIQSGEWRGKAGGYAIQGRAEALIEWLRGSHSGVMGLPLFETRALLKSAGFALG